MTIQFLIGNADMHHLYLPALSVEDLEPLTPVADARPSASDTEIDRLIDVLCVDRTSLQMTLRHWSPPEGSHEH